MKLFLMFFLFLFAGCSFNSNLNEIKVNKEVDVNLLVYMAADNNLERFAIQNILDMKKNGSSSNLNIIVLLDRSPGYDKSFGDWADTRGFRLSKYNTLEEDLIYSYGELDMTSCDTLGNFLSFCDHFFPAKKTILSIWSHGTGVFDDGIIIDNAMESRGRAVICDYTTGYDSSMSINNLSITLNEFVNEREKKIDILLFDACLMQMIEICWELQSVASVIIASQGALSGNGFDYDALITIIDKEGDLDVINDSIDIVNSFWLFYKDNVFDSSCSALNMYTFSKVKEQFISWTYCLKQDIEKIKVIRGNQYSYSDLYTEFIDLNSLLDSILENSDFSNLVHESTVKLKQLLSELIIANKVTNSYFNKLHGLSINFPKTKEELNYYIKDYEVNNLLNIYKESFFDEIIIELNI